MTTASPVQDISVRLDSTDGPQGSSVYRPGQMVTGQVRVRLLRPLTLRNLDLLVQGCGVVSWGGTGRTEPIRDDEVYVNDLAELVSTGVGVTTLSPGEHVFPFACCLPRRLPATFTGGFGSVAYSAKAVMQAAEANSGGPWVAAAAFAVESGLPVGCNLSEQLRPCRVEARMSLDGGGRIKVSLSLPRRVFAAQEDVPVTATVVNRSRWAIARLTVGLRMDCLYQANEGREKFQESLLVADRVDEHRVGHNEGRCWQNVRLRIPRLVPPSELPHCGIISVSYSLVFRAEIERCPKDLNLSIPIVVGVGAAENPAWPLPESAEATLPELMQRMFYGSGNIDDTTVYDTDVWSRTGEGERPAGSTEKRRLCFEHYSVFDPAEQVDGGHLPFSDSFFASGNGDDLY